MRVISETIELKQFALTGQVVITMVDDSSLVIDASINGKEAIEWLQHDEDKNWYESPKPVEATVYWTQEKETNGKTNLLSSAQLSHIIQYNKNTSMVVIRFKLDNNSKQTISGLFCRLSIPGKITSQTYKVPAFTLDENNYIFIENDGVLDHIKVKKIHHQGNDIIISASFPAGVKIITSIIPSPVLGMKLKALDDAK